MKNRFPSCAENPGVFPERLKGVKISYFMRLASYPQKPAIAELEGDTSSYNKFKQIYSRLLGEETSGNHQAYRRGHLDITISNKIKAVWQKECGRNSETV